ncbi:MAG: threonylcarbamoyl-AMP synthase [Pseudomonadales bacterium]|nr:threonylcarbamoyl-AMP synthase [Pseudomonadales bacterium]
MVRIVRATEAELKAAVTALREGDVVAFPTETVYGLGANAQDPKAVRRVFELKGRPADHPLIVHLDDARYLHRWAREVPDSARRLIERFWPGPLTVVLPRTESVSDLVTGGQDSVAIRVPSHPMARQLLTSFGGGIVAPSANRYGRISPTRPEHVREEFGAAIRIVLDGGESQIGLESTIVAFDPAGAVQMLRPGHITVSQLEAVVGPVTPPGAEHSPVRVPGSTQSHYAPSTPMTIVPTDEIDTRAAQSSAGGQRIAVLAQRLPAHTYSHVTWINASRRPEVYARDLYANLRILDKAGCAQILVQDPPHDERWAAVHDRLRRGAASRAD